MRRALPILVACLAAAGCDPSNLGAGPSFREVDAAAARGLLAEPGVRLLQVRDEAHASRALPDAAVVSPEDPLPAFLAGAEGTLIVVAGDRGLALRYAARLARAGYARVAVVDGGLDAWNEAARREAAADAAGG
jgi:rhodanese-related sulfurtransferase